MHVLATAGHVDHGKSTLVRALTGMEPDRWAEERRRGMTIDLGYAWMTLPGGERLAFVDVPGHERFVPNMLAGLGPVPAVMFIVAADGGWMPQSAEHLAAADALGVRHGLLVVTRADLADPGPATREAAAELASTSLGGVEAVAVSAVTGAGLDSLRAALDRLVASLPGPGPADPVRLWIDRSFTIRGSGTVVTGTLPAGTVRAGQELVLTPSRLPVRVRTVQALGEPAEQVTGVARVALNLRGVPPGVPGRGMALITEGRWTLTATLDVRITRPALDGGAATPALPADVLLHIGSARTHARVRILGPAPPGAAVAVFARLTLREALPLHVGDRVLLRDPGAAGLAIFGATVLDLAPPPLARRGAASAAAGDLSGWPEVPAAADLLRRHGLLRAEHPRRGGGRRAARAGGGRLARRPGALGPAARRTASRGRRVRRARPARPRHASRRRPRRPEPPGPRPGAGPARPAPAHPPADSAPASASADSALAPAAPPDSARESAGTVVLDGAYLRIAAPRAAPAPRPGPPPRPAPPGVLAPPGRCRPGWRARFRRSSTTSRLTRSPRRTPCGCANWASTARRWPQPPGLGLLLRVADLVVLAPGADAEAARYLGGLPQPFTTSQARQALRTSRRVVIPLLEYLDRARITERLPGDLRRLRPR